MGCLRNRITDTVERISVYCRKAKIVVNVSIDEIGERHDEIRGVSGSYERAIKTFERLKDLKLSNLSVGIHTVISRFNVDNFRDIHQEMMGLHPDSYVTEIAEERAELDTIGADITPKYEKYIDAIDFLVGEMRNNNSQWHGGCYACIPCLSIMEWSRRCCETKGRLFPAMRVLHRHRLPRMEKCGCAAQRPSQSGI